MPIVIILALIFGLSTSDINIEVEGYSVQPVKDGTVVSSWNY